MTILWQAASNQSSHQTASRTASGRASQQPLHDPQYSPYQGSSQGPPSPPPQPRTPIHRGIQHHVSFHDTDLQVLPTVLLGLLDRRAKAKGVNRLQAVAYQPGHWQSICGASAQHASVSLFPDDRQQSLALQTAFASLTTICTISEGTLPRSVLQCRPQMPTQQRTTSPSTSQTMHAQPAATRPHTTQAIPCPTARTPTPATLTSSMTAGSTHSPAAATLLSSPTAGSSHSHPGHSNPFLRSSSKVCQRHMLTHMGSPVLRGRTMACRAAQGAIRPPTTLQTRGTRARWAASLEGGRPVRQVQPCSGSSFSFRCAAHLFDLLAGHLEVLLLVSQHLVHAGVHHRCW